MQMQKINRDNLFRLKWAYTTRNVDRSHVGLLLSGDVHPAAGDLTLARVDEIGQHRRLELTTSRRADLFEGDHIVVAFGNRYAPDQFEGVVPEHLGPCRLVAAGGVAARLLNSHDRMKQATRITTLGLLADAEGNRLNLRSYRLPQTVAIDSEPLMLAVAGTSMNAGKTTACANLVKGLVRRRLKVAAAKLTGTGAGADYRLLVDAGADPVYDFVDAGYVSTYRISRDALCDVVLTLCGRLTATRPEVIVLEIADGILQQETAQVFGMAEFAGRLDGVMFAANDALGAQAGVAWLAARQLPVIGVTGVLTSSPLATREAEAATGLPVFHTSALQHSNVAALIYNCLRSRRRILAQDPAAAAQQAAAGGS
ncbi:DUF1611 domain-containing protein [Geothermobacter hydrogeniphilus]|uniref:DUF1611 domain-containing protein n=1 Tax=Geothermobacter hydrogeniphilus TaxID=1969733 RepID=A0A2K2HEQ6_9BACT|nr:DUF1611 domain-containing protein [Geothermobacter hydrogeniphilus]PNU21782.1 DUF1611 domain-containing protein [Geothermobacter hydrogeniphilus]